VKKEKKKDDIAASEKYHEGLEAFSRRLNNERGEH